MSKLQETINQLSNTYKEEVEHLSGEAEELKSQVNIQETEL